ncbi:MAG: Peptide deformylase [Chlamydiales bacterium]|nr:Peptide deformylase [Chlamydiales bacterium]MCH9620071.1 Peptide deformylase [Chlamydiales bacterium]MCH9623510.1 Peptide deformylase [Chlamydiales bacterium]
MSLRLRYYGDPVLREKAKRVEEVTDEVRQIAAEMIEIMTDPSRNAIGLAATQVGVLLRMFVSIVYTDKEGGEPHYKQGEPIVFINPIISNPSAEIVEMDEGCLSLPKMYAPVIRPYAVDFEATDLEGNIIKERISGFLARHRMHEVDHLNGVLYIDRIKGKKRTLLDPYLRKIKKDWSR